LPRLRSGEFAETVAWLRWGLDGLATLAVLLMTLAFAGLGLALSFARPAVANLTTVRATAVLAILFLGFSLPFPPPAPVALGWAGSGGPPRVLVREIGHTRLTVDGVPEFELWARFENQGGAVASSRLQFTVWRTTGDGVWAAYRGDVPIPSNVRDEVTMTWRPENTAPGAYRYGVKIADEGSGKDYADLMAADPLIVGR